MNPEQPSAVSHDEAARRFVIASPEGESVVNYERAGQHVLFTHTYVPPVLRGRGVAERLVRHALTWARDQNLAIAASCSYVALFLKRHPDFGRKKSHARPQSRAD